MTQNTTTPNGTKPGSALPKTMRAAVVNDLCGPLAAKVENTSLPEGSHRYSPGQRMLIKVHAAGLAYPDVLMTKGLLQLENRPPFVPGCEASGEVVEAPAGSGFQPGDRVAGSVLGGALAEYALMRPDYTIVLPDHFSFEDGAAFYLNYATAWLALEKAGVSPGETVLVFGAAGGVGTATLDILNSREVTSIAVVSTEAKAKLARKMGADHVVYSTADWLSAVRRITRGRGVDVALDPVTGKDFIDHLRALDSGGRLIVIGFAGGQIPQVKLNRLLLRNLSVIGFDFDMWEEKVPGTARRAGEAIRQLADQNRVRPHIGAQYCLEESGEAISILDNRQAHGKVVVRIRA